MRRVTYTFVLTVIAAAASWMLFSCEGEDEPAIAGSGTVEATEVTVAARTAGEVVKIHVRTGDTVETGDLLAVVDATDLKLQLQQARYRLDAVSAERDLLVSGARPENVRKANATVQEAQEAMELARRTYNRIKNLYEAGSSTFSELDRVTTQFRQSQARLESARAALDLVRTPVRPEELKKAEALVAEAETAAARLARRVSETEIRAPRAGTITVVAREPGETVSPGMPLLVLADLERVYLTIYVPEQRLGHVKIGATATISVDGMKDRTFTGTVTAVADEAEFTPRNVQTEDARAQLVYAIEIGIPNHEGVFKIGMPAAASIAVTQDRRAQDTR